MITATTLSELTGFTSLELASYIMSIKDQIYSEPISNVSNIPVTRSLSKSLCAFLIELHNNGESHYADIRRIVKEKYDFMVNDYSSLQYWRLIDKSSKRGHWTVNERGIAFIEGRLKLADNLTICHQRVIANSNKLVGLDDYLSLDDTSY